MLLCLSHFSFPASFREKVKRIFLLRLAILTVSQPPIHSQNVMRSYRILSVSYSVKVSRFPVKNDFYKFT